MSRIVRCVLLLPLLAACAGGTTPDCGGRVVRPDKPAPRLEGRSVEDGSPVVVEAGEVTFVNVWGSWCGPCREEQPLLNRLAQSHPDVRFVGLNVQDNDAAARTFRKEFGTPYPSISDNSRELANRLGALSTPESFVIDKTGVIRARLPGAADPDTLSCMLDLARK